MPLYEYKCKQCKRHTEHIQKFSDAEITECPSCKGLLERVISAPAISFKGGGWFADGYSHPQSSKPSNETENSPPSSSSSTPESSPSSSKDTTTAPASSGSDSSTAPATAATSTSSSESK